MEDMVKKTKKLSFGKTFLLVLTLGSGYTASFLSMMLGFYVLFSEFINDAAALLISIPISLILTNLLFSYGVHKGDFVKLNVHRKSRQ